jgi:pimeloyl-ACP methyl ester carboxylesterase
VGWLLILLVLGLAAGVPLWLRSRLQMPDPGKAPGEFAELSQGVTHYRWIGPVRGPVVVAIHGLTTPSAVWDGVAQGLGAIGYRVLVYDLYGRGHSDTVAGRQDLAFHLRQLDDLLAHLDLGDDLTVMGYSMGGSVATAFVAAHPGRVRRLILIATAGIEVVQGQFEDWTARLPLVGDWLQAVAGAARMGAAIGADPAAGPLREVQLAELRRPGFLAAVLSSRRGALAARLETEHRAVAAAGVPVVAIWGETDEVVPLRALGTLSSWNRQAAQEVVKAGHGLPHTHATEVMEILRGVLRETV